jgi:hypothetical protein
MRNFAGTIKKIQEVQGIMTRLQKGLKDKRVEASTGGGMIRVVADGNQDIVEIHIDPELIQLKDVGMLQDLLISAVNEVKKRAQELAQEEIKNLSRDVDIQALKDIIA